MTNKRRMNRFIIALNTERIILNAEVHKNQNINLTEDKLTWDEVSKIMNIVRKFPIQSIQKEKLFSCGFAMN